MIYTLSVLPDLAGSNRSLRKNLFDSPMTNYPQKGFNRTNYRATDSDFVTLLSFNLPQAAACLAARIAQQEAKKQIL
jgi:hypothetical protein